MASTTVAAAAPLPFHLKAGIGRRSGELIARSVKAEVTERLTARSLSPRA